MTKGYNWPTILFFAATTAGALIGAPYFALTAGFKLADVLLGVFFFYATTMSITTGYHRLFSHRSYKASAPLRFLVLFFGAAAFEQSALTWASTHRDHHRHADTDLDPYGVKKGFFYAHIGWMLFWKHVPNFSNAKDLQKDPLLSHQHRHYLVWAIFSGILLPMAIGFWMGRPVAAFFLSVCLRLTLVHHATFCINSLSHTFGHTPYDSRSTARDNWLVALITNGEGYHNFHHRFPSDYRNGIRWYHWDPSKWAIAALWRLGLAWDLRRSVQPVRNSAGR
ncbi:MAG TPA: fatty acid desaturase [Candidatus Eisenbacteria bacterium]|jgi:stearoyl-CoA desaturase (delta-9 desaturase)|nr:fatty acid desaturase [Candidatus Eisenbacteria bacterium]